MYYTVEYRLPWARGATAAEVASDVQKITMSATPAQAEVTRTLTLPYTPFLK
jgi:hypothetical protein